MSSSFLPSNVSLSTPSFPGSAFIFIRSRKPTMIVIFSRYCRNPVSSSTLSRVFGFTGKKLASVGAQFAGWPTFRSELSLRIRSQSEFHRVAPQCVAVGSLLVEPSKVSYRPSSNVQCSRFAIRYRREVFCSKLKIFKGVSQMKTLWPVRRGLALFAARSYFILLMKLVIAGVIRL